MVDKNLPASGEVGGENMLAWDKMTIKMGFNARLGDMTMDLQAETFLSVAGDPFPNGYIYLNYSTFNSTHFIMRVSNCSKWVWL